MELLLPQLTDNGHSIHTHWLSPMSLHAFGGPSLNEDSNEGQPELTVF